MRDPTNVMPAKSSFFGSGVSLIIPACLLALLFPQTLQAAAYVRLNQVVYLATEPKRAVLLSNGAETGSRGKNVGSIRAVHDRERVRDPNSGATMQFYRAISLP